MPPKIVFIVRFLVHLFLCVHTVKAFQFREDDENDPWCEDDENDPLTSFQPCPVDDVSFTDYQNVNLEPFIAQWRMHLETDQVPSITAFCKDGTAESCDRGPINFSAAANNGKPRQVVIDTDFQNEVDDYFAVAWALLSSVGGPGLLGPGGPGPSAQLNVTSIIAAPFSFRYRFLPLVRAQVLFKKDILNGYSRLSKTKYNFLYGPPTSPGGQLSKLLRLKDVGVTPEIMIERDNHATWCPDRGMEESYTAIQRFLKLFKEAKNAGIAPAYASIAETPVFRGQTKYLTGVDPNKVQASEGVTDLINQAKRATVEDPLFVVCIAAPTNVASALLVAPEIVGKIVLLWDASWGLENRGRVVSGSLNEGEDLVASRILLESGVRMLYFPGFPSGQTLQLSAPEMEAWYKGQGSVSDAIFQRYNNNPDAQFSGLGYGRYRNAGTTRIMWDIGNFVPFITPGLLSVHAVKSPRLQRVTTVKNTCNGYETIGTTCMAYYPGKTDDEDKYPCQNLDPYNLKQCNDAFFVDATEDENQTTLVEASMLGGLSGPGGSGINLLHQLQAAGL